MKPFTTSHVIMLLFAAVVWGCTEPAPHAVSEEPGNTELVTAPAPDTGVTARDTLFTIIDQPQLSARQQEFLSIIRERPTTIEVHLARLANTPAALLEKDRALGLPVAPGKLLLATAEQVTKRGPDDISWSGSLQGQFGSAGLVLTEKGITGSLWVWDNGNLLNFRFEPISGGLQALIRVDQSKFPRDY